MENKSLGQLVKEREEVRKRVLTRLDKEKECKECGDLLKVGYEWKRGECDRCVNRINK